MTSFGSAIFAFAFATSSVAQAPEGLIVQVRDVTGVGQTKPPSRDASPTSRDNINRRSKNEQKQDGIAKGICIGCGPK